MLGYDKGKQEARQERNIEIAKELLKLEVPIEKIMMATGLSKEEILTIKNE